MMRSLYSGISGLKVHQTKMDVIANNISNVNTIGYKSSRVTFADFFSQSVSGASGANETSGRGGTNPMQIGLGANVASIDINMNGGMGQRTDNNFDLMIDGSGFFVVGDNSGTYFTRAGAFNKDGQGNLVTSSGLNVMGWDVDDVTGEVIRDNVKPIQIAGEKVYSSPQTTRNIELNGNIDSTSLVDVETTMQMFDSLGNSYTYEVKYVYGGTDDTDPLNPITKWTMQIADRCYPDGDKSKAIGLNFNAAGEIELDTSIVVASDPSYSAVGLLSFDVDGNIVSSESGAIAPTDPSTIVDIASVPALAAAGDEFINFQVTFAGAADDVAAAKFGNDSNMVKIDFSEVTQFAQKTTASSERLDGYKAGQLNELSVGIDGTIVGTYSNGTTRVIYQIPVATFANPAGLSKVGGNLFQQTINSGSFDGIGVDVTAAGGTMSGGVLEMSNVDLSAEFTEMITTQRGFQANSRTITTSDEILQELVNLKR